MPAQGGEGGPVGGYGEDGVGVCEGGTESRRIADVGGYDFDALGGEGLGGGTGGGAGEGADAEGRVLEKARDDGTALGAGGPDYDDYFGGGHRIEVIG